VRPGPDEGAAGPLGDELTAAAQLAEAAGEAILRIRRGDLGVEMKPGDEPVTIADRAASDLIVAGLREAFPDDAVISEESADDRARATAARVWYVDPIDGTKDFIRGEDGFAVMIGLCVDGTPAMGLVHQPTTGRTWWATPAGAWTGAPGAATARLTVSDVRDAAGIRLVASKSHRSADIDRVKELLGIGNELNVGSVGLKLCLIAMGERDLYVNPWPKCKAWDTCAPEAILRGAGGELTDTHGDRLRYDTVDLTRPEGLIASNHWVHGDVVARLATLFPRR